MIATFYSYKGGVGRSMAMANVAEILAGMGYQVLVCDWDLEAPGLERYLVDGGGGFQELRSRPGIIDLLLDYKASLARSDPSMTDPRRHRPWADISDLEYEQVGKLRLVRPSSVARVVPSSTRRSGTIRLLPAGRRDGPWENRYADAVQAFNWTEFYDTWAGGAYIEFLRRDLLSDCEIVLVDSRTGVTEQGGVCTHHLADLVVLLSAANDLNLSGIQWMAEVLSEDHLLQMREGRELTLLPVGARIEQTAQKDELAEFRRRFRKEMSGYVPEVLGDREEFLFASEIPYLPFYSFKERVAAREDPSEREERLYRSYVAVAEAIAACGIDRGLIEGRTDEAINLGPTELPPSVAAALEGHAAWLKSGRTEGRRADLTRVQAVGVDLAGVDLTGAVLENAILRRTDLSGAVLSGAKMTGVALTAAKLRAADIHRAWLAKADLDGAVLAEANLSEASLRSASLEAADLREADLRGADLTDANLIQAKLDGARLEGATLVGADLSYAFGLDAANLARADLNRAKLPEEEGLFDSLIAELRRRRRNSLGGTVGLVVMSLLWAAYVYFADDSLFFGGSNIGFWVGNFFLLGGIQTIAMNPEVPLACAKVPARLPDGTRPQEEVLGPMSIPILLLVSLAPFIIGVVTWRYMVTERMLGSLVLAVVAGLSVGAAEISWRSLTGHFDMPREGVAPVPSGGMPEYWFGVMPVAGWVRMCMAGLLLPLASWLVLSGTVFLPSFGILHFEDQVMRGEVFDGEDLSIASFRGGSLDSASFRGSDLQFASFSTVSMRWTDLTGADLSRARLTGIDLGGARLDSAILRGTNLSRAVVMGTSFAGAVLDSADLRSVDLRGAIGLSDDQLALALTDSTTLLPGSAAMQQSVRDSPGQIRP